MRGLTHKERRERRQHIAWAYRDGAPTKTIAEAFGISLVSVLDAAREFGIPHRKSFAQHACKVCGQKTRREQATCGSSECRRKWFYRECECIHCGKAFTKSKRDQRANRAESDYCGRECYLASLEAEKIERTCKCCGNVFAVTEAQLKTKPRLYCGSECRTKYQQANTKPCTICGKPRRAGYKTCGKECADEATRVYREASRTISLDDPWRGAVIRGRKSLKHSERRSKDDAWDRRIASAVKSARTRAQPGVVRQARQRVAWWQAVEKGAKQAASRGRRSQMTEWDRKCDSVSANARKRHARKNYTASVKRATRETAVSVCVIGTAT